MAIKINNKYFKLLEPAEIQIVDIYPSYRSGWNETERKFKNFYYFPNSITQDVLWQGEERNELKEGESSHLRIEEYDKEAKRFKFTKVDTPNYEFFKLYKKVYDIDVIASKNVTVKVWDKESSAEVGKVIPAGEVIRIAGLPATRIQGIAQSMMLTKGIEKIETEIKDRLTGEKRKEMRLPYDWEDKVLGDMVGKSFEFSVNGSGMDTRYAFAKSSFSNVTPKELSMDDVPFR